MRDPERTGGGTHGANQMSGNGGSGCSNLASQPKKVTKIFVDIQDLGSTRHTAGSFCICHKKKFRWNQTKTRYRGGRHVLGHIWSPGGLTRTAAENLFPFVKVYGILKHLYLIFVSLFSEKQNAWFGAGLTLLSPDVGGKIFACPRRESPIKIPCNSILSDWTRTGKMAVRSEKQ